MSSAIEFIVENDPATFVKLCGPYQTSEFIPPNLISIVLSHYFNSNVIIHRFNQNSSHILVKINVLEFLNGPVIKWAYNRPPDLARCPDIARGIFAAKKPVDSLFYASYNNITSTVN